MKTIKFSSFFLFFLFFMSVFIPEASAKHRCRNQAPFGLSFNFGNPEYVVAPMPMVVPPPIYSYPSYIGAPVYPYPYPYPYYNAPVVIKRPSPPVYVRPRFSYSYRGY